MKRRNFLILLPALMVAGCASQSATSDTSGQRFSDAERKLIENHYAQLRARTPAQAMPVPAQRAKAGDIMESGQRPNALPTDLAQQLPHLKEPYTRLVLGADVILLNRETHAVLDVVPQIAY